MAIALAGTKIKCMKIALNVYFRISLKWRQKPSAKIQGGGGNSHNTILNVEKANL